MPRPVSSRTVLGLALPLALASLEAPAAERVPPLDPYLRCASSDSLIIRRTDRVQSGRRQIKIGWKTYDILVEDGYRLLFAYPGASVPMANVKIERGTKRFAKEKKWIIESHKSYDKFNYRQEHWNLHGFDTYASETDSLGSGGVSGHYTAFGDSNRLVVSVYLLNQGSPETNRYRTLEEYREVRRIFLDRLLACADSVRRLEP